MQHPLPIASVEAQAQLHPQDRKRFQVSPQQHVPTLVLDEAGTIRHMTQAARMLLEYRQQDDVDPCFFSHVHGKNLYQVMRDVADIVCHGRSRANWFLRLRTGKGRWRWFRAAVKQSIQGADAYIMVSLQAL